MTREADLPDLIATFQQKATVCGSLRQLRTEEIEAILKAIEFLSSFAVTGNAEKYLPAMLQRRQLRAEAIGALSSSAATGNTEEYLPTAL